MSRPLRIVVTVGTDHHPFDRLVEWLDRWCTEHVAEVDLFVQHGTAKPPTLGRTADYLPYQDLLDAMASADVVVTQGGPMGIVESRRLGRIPLVAPRLRAHGEVVDDHQVDLCVYLASRGDIWLAQTEEEMRGLLDRVLANPSAVRIEPFDSQELVEASVRRFAAAVAALPRRRSGLRQR